MAQAQRRALIRVAEGRAGRPLSIPEIRQAELGLLWAGLQAHLHTSAHEYLRRLPRQDRERLMPFVPVAP